MNWKVIVMAPVALLGLGIVAGIASFFYRVGETWDQGQTNTLVNGLVMVCFGSGMFMAVIASLILGVALAAKILSVKTPAGSGGHGSGAGRGWGKGWGDDPVLDDLNRGGKVIDVYPSVPGARPMLRGPSAGTPITYQPRASGAFDGMDDGDERYGQLRG